jgi:HSP20 family protein
MLLSTPTVRDLERLTARVVESSTRTAGARLDAYRENETFFIDIDLPGVDAASIDITVDGKVLKVRAERTRAEGESVRYVIAERPVGVFSRQVQLSDKLDTDRLEARYDKGVLTLSIPVLEERKPRRIEVVATA